MRHRFSILVFTSLLLGGVFSPARDDAAAGSAGDGKDGKEKGVSGPPIASIARINETNAFFLDTSGRIGVAKFTPELNLIAWDYYTRVGFSEARHLAVGQKLSVVTASPNEMTQGFDLDENGHLDFFQDMITDWPGKKDGLTISCGPVTDPYGRLLFAVAPGPRSKGTATPSTLFGWTEGREPVVLATSSLPIVELSISEEGQLAAWIQLPSYREGYYIALADLPPFDPANPDAKPADPPALLPCMIVPAALTDYQSIGQICFSREDGEQKLFIVSPEAKRLIEMVPRKGEEGWSGPVSVRETFEKNVYSLERMDDGKLLIGGEDGFLPLRKEVSDFRILELRVAPDALEVEFSKPVDRARAVSAEDGISLVAIPLKGELEPFDPPVPLVESDGRTIVLKMPKVPGKAIIKIEAPGLTSEDGESLMFPSYFYTLN